MERLGAIEKNGWNELMVVKRYPMGFMGRNSSGRDGCLSEGCEAYFTLFSPEFLFKTRSSRHTSWTGMARHVVSFAFRGLRSDANMG
jgi:hypothetical protein